MSETPCLGLPIMQAGQAQKHITHNEALLRLDALVQLSVVSRALSAPPGAVAEGARYLVAAGATGLWAGRAGKIAAYQNGAWTFFEPQRGWRMWIEDEETLLGYTGTVWKGFAGTPNLDGLQKLGINTTADTTNRFAVASSSVLLTHEGSGMQLKLNKSAASETVSTLFQTNWSGRAEMGLAGDDSFHIKVSNDGATWKEALVVDGATGRVTLPQTPAVAAPSPLSQRKVGMWNPAGNSTLVPGVFGYTAPTVLGTATARSVATTNMFTRLRRIGYVTAATAGSLAGHYATVNQFSVGDGAGLGGFKLVIRFGISDAAPVAGARMFAGLRNSATVPTNVEPSSLTNVIGLAQVSTSGNLQLVSAGATALAPLDLGASFPAITLSADAYELVLEAPSSTTDVAWRVTRLSTGSIASGTLSAAQVPSAATLMSVAIWRCNNLTPLAAALDIASIYIETDY